VSFTNPLSIQYNELKKGFQKAFWHRKDDIYEKNVQAYKFAFNIIVAVLYFCASNGTSPTTPDHTADHASITCVLDGGRREG